MNLKRVSWTKSPGTVSISKGETFQISCPDFNVQLVKNDSNSNNSSFNFSPFNTLASNIAVFMFSLHHSSQSLTMFQQPGFAFSTPFPLIDNNKSRLPSTFIAVRPLYVRTLYRSPPTRTVLRMALTEDPIELRVREELASDGINLDELLNAGKVLTLTRKLDNLIVQCSSLSSDSSEYEEAQKTITQIEKDLVREKRQVMQSWLKQLFLAQALFFVTIGGALSTNTIPGYSVPLVGQALGFWMTWLFSIPALRARKGTEKWEKSALNVAFLATPLLNLTLPLFTKNCGSIWAADVTLLLGCYAYYAVSPAQSAGDTEQIPKLQKERGRIRGILKYLDWGSWR